MGVRQEESMNMDMRAPVVAAVDFAVVVVGFFGCHRYQLSYLYSLNIQN